MRTGKFILLLSLIIFSRSHAADRIIKKIGREQLESFRFNQKQLDFLQTNGFVIIKKQEPVFNFDDIYKYNLDHGIPNYVTIDSILNTTSKIIHKYLWFIEMERIYPDTVLLSRILYERSFEYYKNINNPLLKKAALDNICFFAVVLSLTGEKFEPPPEIKNKVMSEIELINKTSGVSKSPIFQVNDDYSEYAPESYYRNSKRSQKYYKIKEWLSRKSYILETDVSRELKAANILHNARCSLMVYLAINEGKIGSAKAKSIWGNINNLYSLFFQRDGKYNFYDFDHICFKIFSGPPSIDQLGQDKLIENFLYELKNYQKYNLRSLPSQYVIFNSRVRINKYLLSLQKDQGDFSDVMNILDPSENQKTAGNEIVNKIKNMAENHWFTSIEIRKNTFDAIPASLKANDPLHINSGTWNKRIFLASLGSWIDMTEDKLTGVQKTDKTGNTGSYGTKFTRGFIDPYPEIYRAEREIIKTLLNKLIPYKILSEKAEDNLNRYIILLESLTKLSEKEVEAKRPINNQEYGMIWKIGYELKEVANLPDNYENILFSDTEQTTVQTAFIGENTKKQNIEAALGKPLFLYVLIPDGPNYSIACGPVFSYYEFVLPADKTFTGSDWMELLSMRSPEFPSWVKDMIYE